MPTRARPPLEHLVDRAFERSSPLVRARFGPFAIDVLADEASQPQGFETALLGTPDPADIAVALVAGRDAVLDRYLPEPLSDMHLMSAERFYVQWSPAPTSMLSVYDRETRRGVTWFPDGTAPHWIVGQPLIPVIHAATIGTGWCVAHAAAVGRVGRFVLMPGPGKAGKSTAALACMRAGWDYAGDDFVLLDPGRGIVAPMFSSARVRQTGVRDLADIVAGTTYAVSDDEGMDRYELRLPVRPMGGQVAAIVLVRRTGSAPFQFRRVRNSEALTALVYHSMARAPGYAEEMVRKQLAAARMGPAFVVDTGTDPAAIPAGFQHFLEGLAT